MTDRELTMWACGFMDWEFKQIHGRFYGIDKNSSIRDPIHDANHRDMVVEKLAEKFDVSICWYAWNGKLDRTVEISMRENDPRYPKGGCRESGDERLAYVENISIGRAVLLAAKAALEE